MKARWEYRTSAAVLVLGILAALLLVWTYLIGERQKKVFAFTYAATELRVRTALFHLWFEEAISNEAREDMENAFVDLRESLELSGAILSGGRSRHGTALPALEDPELRRKGELLRSLLFRLQAIAVQRMPDPKNAGIGSTLDKEFNQVFRQFDREARSLEVLAGQKWMNDQARTSRLHILIIDAWILIILASATAFFRSGRRSGRAAQVDAPSDAAPREETAG